MAAETTVAFYGVRFPIAEEEITLLEDRTHHLLVKARTNGLNVYWSNFGTESPLYLLLIGDRLGILGPENDREISLAMEDFASRAEKTNARLRVAGISETARLYLQWQPDL